MQKSLRVLTAALAVTLLTAACSQSDPGITASVKSKLATDDQVKAYEIDVDTHNKIVTLSGTVATQAEKSRAVDIARRTSGVASVRDLLTVNPDAVALRRTGEDVAGTAGRAADQMKDAAREAKEESYEAGERTKAAAGKTADTAGAVASDGAVTAAVKTKLLADREVAGLDIDVDTSNRVVTLTGTVRNDAERAKAVKIARETDGVNGVVSKLEIRK